jgi:hypothetical protein
MSEHTVQIVQVPDFEVLKKDLRILIRADESTLGHLTISRGGIGWLPSGAPLERHFTWEQFAQLVDRQFPS